MVCGCIDDQGYVTVVDAAPCRPMACYNTRTGKSSLICTPGSCAGDCPEQPVEIGSNLFHCDCNQ
jgi:hypothetical protein